jgi:preprotein translocase subunit YajC
MKKAKDHKKMVEELKIGDKVVTTAGIHGKIVGAAETTFLIETEGGGKIRFDKSAISLDATKAAAPKA